jgi:hypothetical protein
MGKSFRNGAGLSSSLGGLKPRGIQVLPDQKDA